MFAVRIRNVKSSIESISTQFFSVPHFGTRQILASTHSPSEETMFIITTNSSGSWLYAFTLLFIVVCDLTENLVRTFVRLISCQRVQEPKSSWKILNEPIPDKPFTLSEVYSGSHRWILLSMKNGFNFTTSLIAWFLPSVQLIVCLIAASVRDRLHLFAKPLSSPHALFHLESYYGTGPEYEPPRIKERRDWH